MFVYITTLTVYAIFVILRTCSDNMNLMHFSGQCTLTMAQAWRGIEYKYMIVKKGDVYWEYLAEFPPTARGAIVNRILKIPENFIKPGGKRLDFDKLYLVHYCVKHMRLIHCSSR